MEDGVAMEEVLSLEKTPVKSIEVEPMLLDGLQKAWFQMDTAKDV